MPEGPEVRKNAQDLARIVSGKRFNNIEILSGRYSKKVPSGLAMFSTQLPIGVIGAGSHGKFMYIICDDEWSIWITLGMTGGWGSEQSSHSRIRIKFDNGNIYFNDMRNFGTIKFVHSKFKLIEKLKSLGPDMLAENVLAKTFATCLRVRPTWTIAKALMDQSIIAGVGNYIKSDSLWLAKISPHRLISDMTDSDMSNLNRAIGTVMRESFAQGGSTINSYSQFSGNEGEYNRKFLVYNQSTDVDGNKVVRETTTDKRTTHWCPSVQI